MDIKKETPIIVRAFHYDLNEEPQVKSEVNFGLHRVAYTAEDGSVDNGEGGNYFELRVVFEVATAPGEFTVSGVITQIVQLVDYYGEGDDLTKNDYTLLSRPLVEDIETLTYEVTQVALDKPVNLNFEAQF